MKVRKMISNKKLQVKRRGKKAKLGEHIHSKKNPLVYNRKTFIEELEKDELANQTKKNKKSPIKSTPIKTKKTKTTPTKTTPPKTTPPKTTPSKTKSPSKQNAAKTLQMLGTGEGAGPVTPRVPTNGTHFLSCTQV